MKRRLLGLEVCLLRHIFGTSSFVTVLVERTEALSEEVLEHKKKSRAFCNYIFLQHQ
jgi:hypothetical protein